jgi:hypothetical protein
MVLVISRRIYSTPDQRTTTPEAESKEEQYLVLKIPSTTPHSRNICCRNWHPSSQEQEGYSQRCGFQVVVSVQTYIRHRKQSAEVFARRSSLRPLDTFRIKQDKEMISKLASLLEDETIGADALQLMVGLYAQLYVFSSKIPRFRTRHFKATW